MTKPVPFVSAGGGPSKSGLNPTTKRNWTPPKKNRPGVYSSGVNISVWNSVAQWIRQLFRQLFAESVDNRICAPVIPCCLALFSSGFCFAFSFRGKGSDSLKLNQQNSGRPVPIFCPMEIHWASQQNKCLDLDIEPTRGRSRAFARWKNSRDGRAATSGG